MSEEWDVSDLEDLPGPREESLLPEDDDEPITWCLGLCSDSRYHAFELDAEGDVIEKAICGRGVHRVPDESDEVKAPFCKTCIYMKAPN